MKEEPKKIEGYRKMGIGISAIAALSLATIDFKTAVIIGIIACVGIVAQSILDNNKEKPNVEKANSIVNSFAD